MPTTNLDPIPGFDAVAESRKWKEAVARETAGMTMDERIAYYRRHSSIESGRRASAAESSIVREEPSKE